MKIDRHHKFAKHKNRKIRYGALIHSERNIELIEHNDHLSGRARHLNEREFCAVNNILFCKYCFYYIPGYSVPCLHFYGVQAEKCRSFSFDKSKYKGA